MQPDSRDSRAFYFQLLPISATKKRISVRMFGEDGHMAAQNNLTSQISVRFPGNVKIYPENQTPGVSCTAPKKIKPAASLKMSQHSIHSANLNTFTMYTMSNFPFLCLQPLCISSFLFSSFYSYLFSNYSANPHRSKSVLVLKFITIVFLLFLLSFLIGISLSVMSHTRHNTTRTHPNLISSFHAKYKSPNRHLSLHILRTNSLFSRKVEEVSRRTAENPVLLLYTKQTTVRQ